MRRSASFILLLDEFVVCLDKPEAGRVDDRLTVAVIAKVHPNCRRFP